MNKEYILSELIKSRDALNTAIAYVETGAGVQQASSLARSKTIRAGEGRGIAILTSLRDSGMKLLQHEFEDACLRNSRTLVGAGGFIARGSIERRTKTSGEIEYELTKKGLETITKWEARYGASWREHLEKPEILGEASVQDHQKIFLVKSENNA